MRRVVVSILLALLVQIYAEEQPAAEAISSNAGAAQQEPSKPPPSEAEPSKPSPSEVEPSKPPPSEEVKTEPKLPPKAMRNIKPKTPNQGFPEELKMPEVLGKTPDLSEFTLPPTPAPTPAPTEPFVPSTFHHIVGSFNSWDPNRPPMEGPKEGPLRTRLTVRDEAKDSPHRGAGKREEFQILGDGEWSKRLFPLGEMEEAVDLPCHLPNETVPGQVAFSASKGNGRNWAVDGHHGTSFDIILNLVNLTVSCEYVPPDPAKTHSIVGSWNNWNPHKEQMVVLESGVQRHRITVRENAADSPEKDKGKREEFQIVGDGSWHKRLYPAGDDREEVVVLQSGGAASAAAMSGSKGHGRNWAIEGAPGVSVDIILDPKAMTVKSHIHSRNPFRNEI
eukprot:gnl/MRDRNA2_/MRDRNA2_31746_c0_seq1.p1 gnl/MRDRNA2_/MRDRNA2_31746_c0~~gnl/MRDRNA2_/MRDRNA2_31746_c0_seq1.p1  ORF type:complete len:392 (-),score=85.43 gnl/MRDRNA2_/MRDRNA2_31746_c0_seq1:22-1197(-)